MSLNLSALLGMEVISQPFVYLCSHQWNTQAFVFLTLLKRSQSELLGKQESGKIKPKKIIKI